ncbi:MAG TPA: ROK family protein, partial [Candidatus Bathyarchaeia archaeon]|nr:ROK family protein [Candidatus Bathyarchaeia archaeon]
MSQTEKNSSRKTSDDEVTIGVDLGGTNTTYALIDSDGHILSSHKQLTDAGKGTEGVLADLVAGIREHLATEKGKVTKLAIGVAGQVTPEGVVLLGPNLGWRNVPLRAKLERELKIPAVVLNDVRAAAIGEWLYGSGRGVYDLVVLFVGTGVGGGVISRGRVI